MSHATPPPDRPQPALDVEAKRYYAFVYGEQDPSRILGDGPGVPRPTCFVLAADYDALLATVRQQEARMVALEASLAGMTENRN